MHGRAGAGPRPVSSPRPEGAQRPTGDPFASEAGCSSVTEAHGWANSSSSWWVWNAPALRALTSPTSGPVGDIAGHVRFGS